VEDFRTICGIVRPVAAVEDEARDRAIGRRYFQAVAAPVDARLDRGRGVGTALAGSGCNAARIDDRLLVPGPVAAIPLPALVEAQQFPLEALALPRLAIVAKHDDVETRQLALTNLAAGEEWLDADARAIDVDGQRHHALDRAAAGLAQLQDDIGLEL